MSKSLRTFLLSMLAVVLVASCGFATTLTFDWNGSNSRYWGDPANWTPSVSYDMVITTDDEVKNSIQASNQFYPGSFTANTYSVDVVISKDVELILTQPNGTAIGSIRGITSLNISADVVLNLGSASYFSPLPAITISQDSSLVINGTKDDASAKSIIINTRGTKIETSGDLKINAPILYTNGGTLSIDVYSADLTMGNDVLLSSADIKIHGGAGRIIFDIPASASTLEAPYASKITLKDDANTIFVSQDVTIKAYSYDVLGVTNGAIISTDSKLVKAGKGTLTLARSATAYKPVLDSSALTSIQVSAGALKLDGAATLSVDEGKQFTFTVNSGASLDIGAKSVKAGTDSVDLVVSGTLVLGSNGIDNGDVYSGDKLNLVGKVSADIKSGGTLSMSGTQAFTHIQGAGKIETADGAMLIISGDKGATSSFTGILESSDIGIASSFDRIPFIAQSADVASVVENFYVFGGGNLTLDKATIPSDLDLSDTNIYLRSNYPGANTEAALTALSVGKLTISRDTDVTLGILKVDGTKYALGIASILFESADSELTVNDLVLHANSANDFSGTGLYVTVHGIVVSGDGKLTPNKISNGSDLESMGSNTSITVQGGAELVLGEGVEIPPYNSLLLDNSYLDVANKTVVPGDFNITGNSLLKVYLTGKNATGYESNGENAVSVGGNLYLNVSEDETISVDISLTDANRFLGKRYKIVGTLNPSSEFSSITTTSPSFDVIGDYEGAMHVSFDSKGIYGILTKWIVQPEIADDWTFVTGGETFGKGNSEFEVNISYDAPAEVSPDTLGQYVRASFDVAGTVFTENDGRVLITKDGKDIAFLFVELDKTKKVITLSGTSYVTSLDVKIDLGWYGIHSPVIAPDRSADVYRAYSEAKIKATNRALLSEDFRPRTNISRPITNVNIDDINPESEDVYTEEPDIESVNNTVTFEEGDTDAVFKIFVPGMSITTPGSNSATLVFENGVYSWKMTTVSDTDVYEMTDRDGSTYQVLGRNIVITVNGVQINNMASVDITTETLNGTTGSIVSIPVVLLGTASTDGKEVEITAMTENGNTIKVPAQTVWIRPNYPLASPDVPYVVFENGGEAKSYTVADVSDILGETVEYDTSMGDNPAGLEWNNASGIVAYKLSPDIAVGTYNMVVLVYNEAGEGRKYEFTVEVVPQSVPAISADKTTVTVTIPDGTDTVTFELLGGATDLALSEDSSNPAGLVTLSGNVATINATGVAEGTYTYTFTATSADAFTLTVNVAQPTLTLTATDRDDFGNASAFVAGRTYATVFMVEGAMGEVKWEFASGDYFAGDFKAVKSGDNQFIVEGVVALANDEDGEPADQSFIVRVSTASQDADEEEVTFAVDAEEISNWDPESELTVTGNKDAVSGDFTVTLPTGFTVADDMVNYPSWITPTYDEDGNITGFRYAGQAGDIPNGTLATIVIEGAENEDGETKNYSMLVTYAGYRETPAPQPGPESGDQPGPGPQPGPDSGDQPGTRTFTVSTSANSVEIDLATSTTGTVTLTPANASGDVTYSSTVSPATGLAVAVANGTATFTATAEGSYTVTFTATDAGGSTATARVTVTVTDSTPDEPVTTTFSLTRRFASRSFDISLSPLTLSIDAVVTPVNNQGTVSYTATTSDEDLSVSIDNTARSITLTALEAGTYTVTLVGTDTAGNTASATFTIVVTETWVGSSGGGCDAGFGALALALAMPLFLRRRRS